MESVWRGRQGMTRETLFESGPMGRRGWALLALIVALLLSGCAQWGQKRDAAKFAGIKYRTPLSTAELNGLPLAERIRYFTDNVYMAAEGGSELRASRAAAAESTLEDLRKSLDKKSFVGFWAGVDPEFFGRVNADLGYTDYTHPQMILNSRQTRTAYYLRARHLKVLGNLGTTRREAMQDLIDLAEEGDNAACFTFHKAYKDYADPRHGEAGISWLDVDGVPFRKSSMWAGSGEATYKGHVVQIAIPPQAVLGCRRILHPTDQVTAGVVEEVEQFFSAINLDKEFSQAAYTQHKEAWRRQLQERATAAARRIRLHRIRVINVVDVYRIFPPALDYEYELAVADGTLSDMVATGMLSEEQAFVVEERIHERRVLLTGVGATPEQTPMAFLQLVADRSTSGK